MKSRKDQHQGKLTPVESRLVSRMTQSPNRWFTTLDICTITGCISARDKIRKLRANHILIGPVKFMRETETGARIYAWRIAQ